MLRPFVYKKLLEYGQKIQARTRAKLKRKPLSSSSSLVKSVTFKVFQNGKIEFYYNDYGDYVDSGRKKGNPPPVSALKKWAESKGLNPYAVSKSIGKKGIKAYPWVEESFPSNNNRNRATLELEALWEEITIMQIDYDIDQLED